MKKTLIALALAALPVAAMADVTLYGQIKGGVEYTKVNGRSNSITNVNDWGSRIGFKGEEDLGNGLKTIWQIEQSVSLDRGSNRNDRWANRDSFIGLATPFGTVRAGTLSDQFNSDMDTLDPWEGNTGESVRTLANTFGRTSERYTAVRYDTPEFAGFQANVLYSPEDNTRYAQLGSPQVAFAGQTAQDLINTTANNAVVAVGLNYQNSGFYAKYGFKMIRDNVDNGYVHRLEGGYDANNLFVGLGFQYTKDYDAMTIGGVATPVDSYKEVALTAAYTLGNLTPRITYAHGFKAKVAGNSVDNTDYNQVIIGADYALSKRTTALVSAGWMKTGLTDLVAAKDSGSDKNSAYSVGLGLRHRF